MARVQAPLLQQEVEALSGPDRQGLVPIDIDLSGQKVRGEAKQYTGTDFGYMQGKLARGYQIVAAFLSGQHQLKWQGQHPVRGLPAGARRRPCPRGRKGAGSGRAGA